MNDPLRRALQEECPGIVGLIDGNDPRLSPATSFGLALHGILAIDPASGSRLLRSNGRSTSGRGPLYYLAIEHDGQYQRTMRFRAWTYAEALAVARGKFARVAGK